MTGATTTMSRMSSALMPKSPERNDEHKSRRTTRSFFGRSLKSHRTSPSSKPLESPREDISRRLGLEESSATEDSDVPISPSISNGPLSPSIDERKASATSGSEARSSVDYLPHTPTSNERSLSSSTPSLEINRTSDTLFPLQPETFHIKPETKKPSRPRPLGDWDIYPTIEEEELAEKYDDGRFSMALPIQMDEETSIIGPMTKLSVSTPTSISEYHPDTGDSFLLNSRDNSPVLRPLHDSSPYETAPSDLSVSPSFTDIKMPPSALMDSMYEVKDADITPFLTTLAQMESAGLKTMCKRLGDEWDELAEENPGEIAFEKRIWATIASQWLTFGKQLQSPGHELLSQANIAEPRKALHLHGPIADGWVLAAKYTNATVYSVSLQNIPKVSSRWEPPSNHRQIQTSSVHSSLPFPDNYFDVVVTRTLSSVLKADELDSVLRESYRVLRPGGWLEIHTIDPTLTRAGDITKRWIESRILVPMENNFFSVSPSHRILALMNELGYNSVKSARIALPVVPISRIQYPTSAPSDMDAQKVMVYLGRQLYAELYDQFLKAGHIGHDNPTHLWHSKAVKKECERSNTCFALTISFGRKA